MENQDRNHHPRSVGTSACVVCYRRKVRCDRHKTVPCSNCVEHGYECSPRQRKRKRHDSAPFHPASPPSSSTDFLSSNLNCPQPGPHDSSQHPLPALEKGFLGRSQYLGDTRAFDESLVEDSNEILPHSTLSPDDVRVLEIRKAYELPDRATTEALISNFLARCHPWMPLVDEAKLQNLTFYAQQPLVLRQALFMAASRIHSRLSASSEAYYNRAKVLFFMGCERDPMALIITTCILQWWNPSGPERVSIHNSSYWLRIGIGLAQQIGLHHEPDPRKYSIAQRRLRRRVWWTLFARDCLLSAGQGRPRAINPDDCFVRPITVADFSQLSKHAHMFVAYVEISSIMGRSTDWYLRGATSALEYRRIEQDLQQWTRGLPEVLRPTDPSGQLNTYDFDLWQLYLPYFATVCIVYRNSRINESLHLTALVAASCIIRIAEDMMAHDELRHVNAMVAIYLLIAGVALLSCYGHPTLWPLAKPAFEVAVRGLDELSSTWHTAKGSLRILRLAQDMLRSRTVTTRQKLEAHTEHASYFDAFGDEFSCQSKILMPSIRSGTWLLPFNGGLAAPTVGTPSSRDESQLPLSLGDHEAQMRHRTGIGHAELGSLSLNLEETSPMSMDLSMDLYTDWFLQGWEFDETSTFANV